MHANGQELNSGRRLADKLYRRLVFLRRDLQMHPAIVESDLFREYLACAAPWLRASYCLMDLIERVKNFGLTGFFLDTGWWQQYETTEALALVGAEVREQFELSRQSFDAGLDPDVGLDKERFCQSILEALCLHLSSESEAAYDWLVLMNRYGALGSPADSGTAISPDVNVVMARGSAISPYGVQVFS
ncbi:MAG TPA: hypothetical protein PK671_16095 [Candidatus Obscuribacter sp.]|nr:hypothetical protein [Candidatus Obscuribacter sp.]HNA73044.1 hypothetical protein [Candidatus Obscuribacter sp.]HND06272.1 hypothetical protein [Candidatus Obscuribacter sp.]